MIKESVLYIGSLLTAPAKAKKMKYVQYVADAWAYANPIEPEKHQPSPRSQGVTDTKRPKDSNKSYQKSDPAEEPYSFEEEE